MKKFKIANYIVTGLFAAFMVFSSYDDVISSPRAVEFVTKLGYPLYFIPYIGVAKILGCIAIVIPGYPRLKEWAYAGLIYDLVSATYSFMAMKYPASSFAFMFFFIAFGFASYFLYHKARKGAVIA